MFDYQQIFISTERELVSSFREKLLRIRLEKKNIPLIVGVLIIIKRGGQYVSGRVDQQGRVRGGSGGSGARRVTQLEYILLGRRVRHVTAPAPAPLRLQLTT